MKNFTNQTSRKWLTVPDACHRWGIGKTKLYELLRSNRLIAVKLGSRTLIDAEYGDAFIASLPTFGGE